LLHLFNLVVNIYCQVRNRPAFVFNKDQARMISTGNKSLVNSTKNSTQILLNVSARKDVLSGISTSLRKTPRTACFEAQVNLIIMQPSDLLRKKMKGQITAAAGSKRLGREQGTLSSSANLVKSLPPIPKTREEKEPLDRSAKARAEVLETIAEHKKLTDVPSQKQDASGIESEAKASIAAKRAMRMVRPGEVKLVDLTKGEREPSVRGGTRMLRASEWAPGESLDQTRSPRRR